MDPELVAFIVRRAYARPSPERAALPRMGPRMVAVWLCVSVAKGASLPKARRFVERDHTQSATPSARSGALWQRCLCCGLPRSKHVLSWGSSCLRLCSPPTRRPEGKTAQWFRPYLKNSIAPRCRVSPMRTIARGTACGAWPASTTAVKFRIPDLMQGGEPRHGAGAAAQSRCGVRRQHRHRLGRSRPADPARLSAPDRPRFRPQGR